MSALPAETGHVPDPIPIITVRSAGPDDHEFAEQICAEMADAARIRGTGIAKRTPEYILGKMDEGKAIIAICEGRLAGFCYIETWEHGRYVANSGLIVVPAFRKHGLARRIKRLAFNLSRERYPDARLFGITTSLAVMKVNADLGYRPVTFSELTQDDVFWSGCNSCPNVDILKRTNKQHCLCTGMLFDPQPRPRPDDSQED